MPDLLLTMISASPLPDVATTGFADAMDSSALMDMPSSGEGIMVISTSESIAGMSSRKPVKITLSERLSFFVSSLRCFSMLPVPAIVKRIGLICCIIFGIALIKHSRPLFSSRRLITATRYGSSITGALPVDGTGNRRRSIPSYITVIFLAGILKSSMSSRLILSETAIILSTSLA